MVLSALRQPEHRARSFRWAIAEFGSRLASAQVFYRVGGWLP